MHGSSVFKSSAIFDLLRSHCEKRGHRAPFLSRREQLSANLCHHSLNPFLSHNNSPILVSTTNIRRRHRSYAIPPQNSNEVTSQPRLISVSTSVVFYGAMAAVSIVLGQKYNLVDQILNSPLNFESSLPYLCVMTGLSITTIALAEILPDSNLKELFQKILIPELQQISLLGLALMATGAGVGEEMLFRGVLQNWVIEQAVNIGLIDVSVQVGVIVSSFVFGLAHAITPSYFVFALVAGVILGVEYLNIGLPAAAFTHALYDFIAFVLVIQYWGNNNKKKNEMKS